MGVTIHYRGSLADLGRVEDFEDRVIDLALVVGGDCRVWRSADEQDTSRVVRGLILDLAPGQESTSLLISPEGWLIGLMEIEDAERGVLTEKPWCWVETQFGPIEGHVALVELLTALKAEFMPDLEVSDESGYWERRDVAILRQKMEFLGRAISTLTAALENDRLSPEAAEDPEILATRIERLARKVHETLSRPAEHAPVRFPENETGVPSDPAENEARWDELYRENRRKQERMERVMEEQLIRGEDAREALEAAIEDVVPPIDWDDDAEQDGDRSAVAELIAELNESSRAAAEDEPWQEGVSEWGRPDDEDDAFERMERHPLQQQATNLLLAFHNLAERVGERSPSIDMLMRNAMEVTGGLAQVMPLPPVYEMDDSDVGLSLVQLKRALRGAGFMRGALFLLRSEELLGDDEFRRYTDEADALSDQITNHLRSIREAKAS